MERQFQQLLQEQGVQLNDQQLKQFETYFEQLVEWNEKMNLTGITEREQVYIKHFYDSVSLSCQVPLQTIQSIADIGSGAGFPSIPLKIVYPHLQVCIVDSLNKRIQFLNHLVEALGLKSVQCVHGRAEDVARQEQFREHFDLVTARAVAKLNILNELCIPFVKVNGLFVAMKGTDPGDEIEEASFSFKELRAQLLDVHELQLPVEHSVRHLIVIKKLAATSGKYPRKAGTPAKSPL